ncbi:glycine zipper 2TM domain-containing protein [Novosphingobium panipatense]|jgi:hypothetical protein|uniref:glycine zipper 2TM domain-containing protein n=1 Tax=Novosphingobium TaxID=165696 RepID=UPI000CDA0114|nr:glycine zipper 2TM domain-containing protein [Novosphingobium sp. HII-3]
MKKSLLAMATFAATLTALPTTPVSADPPSWARAEGRRDRDRYERRDDGRDRNDIYDSRGRYREPRRITRDSRVWRGTDGRYYCKRDNGTTGLLIGAGVGALAGNQIAGSGDRAIGTILGGVLGGVVGREIDKGDVQCR